MYCFKKEGESTKKEVKVGGMGRGKAAMFKMEGKRRQKGERLIVAK